jgi:probable rRNA maturation factor
LRRVVVAALRAAGAPTGSGASLTLTDDAEIADLNEAHMGKPGPTDVLAFPLLPPGRFPTHPGQDPGVRRFTEADEGFRLPPGVPLHLGDVVVSVERAIEQATSGQGGHANDRAWAPVDELRLLVTHGALHLCGWDHADPVEREAMRALEQDLLGLG